MPDEDTTGTDVLELKIGARWGKTIFGLLGLALGGMGGGATGTWLAPQASAQAIEKAATEAAEKAADRASRIAAKEAVEAERRVTEERFKTVDAKLDAQGKTIERIEGQVDRIYDAVKR